MFGLSTLKAMNKSAAARYKEGGFCGSNPVARPKVEPDFHVQHRGPNGGVMLTPLTEKGKALCKTLFPYKEDYQGRSVVVQHRDLPSFLHHVQVAGLTTHQL